MFKKWDQWKKNNLKTLFLNINVFIWTLPARRDHLTLNNINKTRKGKNKHENKKTALYIKPSCHKYTVTKLRSKSKKERKKATTEVTSMWDSSSFVLYQTLCLCLSPGSNNQFIIKQSVWLIWFFLPLLFKYLLSFLTVWKAVTLSQFLIKHRKLDWRGQR